MKKALSLLILITTLFFVSSCGSNNDIKIETKYRDKTILSGTLYETKAHYYSSNKEGFRVAIVGGIHGDEIAGWTAAEKLVSENPFFGEVLLIPRLNFLATELRQRYPGAGNKGLYNEVQYHDINRVFPGKEDGTITEQIAYEVVKVINEFNPEYVIDLHESLRSYSDPNPRLGDEVIYSNSKSAGVALQIVERFNELYLEEGDVRFIFDNNPPSGSFNYHFGFTEQIVSLTFETNRQLPIAKRIDQQLKLIQVFFDVLDTYERRSV